MNIDPAHLAPADRYKLLIGGIVPRPIAWVSTIAPDGRTNLAPFSFFCGVGSDPMTLLFCPANKPDGSLKDTFLNASLPADGGTGHFVVNVVPERLGMAMALCATPLARGDSEFHMPEVEALGITQAPSVKVLPPRVAQSPISFECRTLQTIRTNPGTPAGGNIVLGEVLHVHIDDAIMNDRFHIDPSTLDAIGRMGGTAYARTRDRFDLPMGRGNNPASSRAPTVIHDRPAL